MKPSDPLPPLDVGCRDPIFDEIIAGSDEIPPQIILPRDLPEFGFAAGDVLMFDDEWPERKDIVLISLEAKSDAYVLGRFLGCFGETVKLEHCDGSVKIYRFRTMAVLRQVDIEIRPTPRSKKRIECKVLVSRWPEATHG